MSSLWGREPALILACVQAVLACAVGFGLDLTSEQMALVLAATAAVLGLVVRQQVTPTATLAEKYEPRHDTG
jgi:hypothetical protein